MKTIIAGSRNFTDLEITDEKLGEVPWRITEVVSGTARGADQCGEWYARKWNIDLKTFPADWKNYGKSAGYIRNGEMAEYADALVAFWDGESKGTKHMINLAIDHGLYVKVFYV